MKSPLSFDEDAFRGTVLCVDNDAKVLEIVASVLRRNNFAVLPAKDEAGARELLREHTVDVAVIDVRLHDEDNIGDSSGLLLAQEFATRVHVIIFSSYDPDYEEFAKVQGAVAVSKRNPAWESDLLNKVRRVIKPMVYIAHGHSPRTTEVELYVLTVLGLRVCIQEKLPGGERILDQLAREAARAEFGVVLLTGEDRCTGADSAEPLPRARQIVILEWGYLLARLGPENVLVLHEEGVELPSNYGGFVYENFDVAGHWKSRLADKLRAVRLIPTALTSW